MSKIEVWKAGRPAGRPAGYMGIPGIPGTPGTHGTRRPGVGRRAGSGSHRNRAIQHYLVRPSLRPQGAKSGLSWPKPALLARKPALAGYPGPRIPGCQPRDPAFAGSRGAVPLEFPYCFSGEAGKRVYSRVFRVFPGIPGIPRYSRVFPVFPCIPCIPCIPVYSLYSRVFLYLRPVGQYYCVKARRAVLLY